MTITTETGRKERGKLLDSNCHFSVYYREYLRCERVIVGSSSRTKGIVLLSIVFFFHTRTGWTRYTDVYTEFPKLARGHPSGGSADRRRSFAHSLPSLAQAAHAATPRSSSRIAALTQHDVNPRYASSISTQCTLRTLDPSFSVGLWACPSLGPRYSERSVQPAKETLDSAGHDSGPTAATLTEGSSHG